MFNAFAQAPICAPLPITPMLYVSKPTRYTGLQPRIVMTTTMRHSHIPPNKITNIFAVAAIKSRFYLSVDMIGKLALQANAQTGFWGKHCNTPKKVDLVAV